ncbi:MAG: coproporphyrinogen III oxidase family protein [SAR324 cluster bacterium]|nr:coproporphyrinogen III oxidase family protein [SAR324 cluster bacterium]
MNEPQAIAGALIEALYIHVPFCRTICPFCAFAVHGDQARLHRPYLEALEREAALRAGEFSHLLAPRQKPGQKSLQSVYIGGGTPSALSLPEVERLLGIVRKHFTLAPDTEISFELNPEDARPDHLRGLVSLGVTRFSLGLQSLDDATLRALGRNNDANLGREAWEAIHALGVDSGGGSGGNFRGNFSDNFGGNFGGNFNVDLMFGAPGIEPAPFRRDVEWVADRGTPHISLYGLEIEPGTLFARDPSVREWAEDKRDAQAETYLWAVETLTARGYHHYEVSNFSRPGSEGRQNLIVWDGGAYLGLGPGAFSTVAGVRWRNARHLRAWMRRLENGEDPKDFEETPSRSQRADETLMLSLRRDSGLDIGAWEETHGLEWGPKRERLAGRLAAEGKATLRDGRLILTSTGLLLADEITAALAVEE